MDAALDPGRILIQYPTVVKMSMLHTLWCFRFYRTEQRILFLKNHGRDLNEWVDSNQQTPEHKFCENHNPRGVESSASTASTVDKNNVDWLYSQYTR
jgi:hypothetical protein